MQTTGMSRGDGAAAMVVALVVNGLIVWQLQGLLAPHRIAMDDAAAPLQVVWIAAVPRRPVVVAAPARHPSTIARAPRMADRAIRADAPAPAPPERPADSTPARPMTAVYLQQARQWAQQQPATAPADPFANRHVAFTDQAGSRFRLKRQASVAGTLAMVGRAFGGPGYTTDDCALIRGRVVGLVVGGDEQAAQQDLDYERRHCLP